MEEEINSISTIETQSRLEEENFRIQDTEETEIDQAIYDLESYFHQPIGQEIDTEWNQAREQTMEHIFVLQDIGTPPTNTMTQSGQLMPMDLLKQPGSSKSTKPMTNHVTEQIEANIQKNFKYGNIQISYSFQIYLAVILILAVSHQCDASMATNALLPLIKGATSHSSTWLQVKNIVPKQKHWVDKLRHLENWEISHWVNPFSLELQPICASSK